MWGALWVKEKKMNDFFKDLKSKIEKNVSGVHASVLSQSNVATDRFFVHTPCYDLNRILSGSLKGGIQSRNLMSIVGPEHSMKSSFMVLCMVNAQKQGFKPIIIDTEGGCDAAFCRRWGLDPDNLFYVYTPWIDEVGPVLAQIKEMGEENLVIGLDSVGGLQRLKSFRDALDGDMKQDQGLLQKDIRSVLKLFLNICIKQNCIGIATGHYYGSPNAQGYVTDQIGGGKAMKLFPSIIVTLKKFQLHEDENVKSSPVIGNKIVATTIKNRVYPPFQDASVMIDYKTGVQPMAGILDLAIQSGIIEKSGSWYSHRNGERIGQGKIKAMEGLMNLDGFLDEIDEWLKNTGYSSYNVEAKEAEAKEVEELEKEEEVKEPKKIKSKREKKDVDT